MNPSLKAYDSKIVKIVKQLHKTRREIWRLQDEGRIGEHHKRQRMNSRRDQKIRRRRKGLQHMIRASDKLLEKYRPKDITLDKFIKDCEKAVNISELHSDEWSTEDEGLANEKTEQNKRPEQLADSNSVIVVHEKNWRSSPIKKVLYRAEEIEPEDDDDDNNQENDEADNNRGKDSNDGNDDNNANDDNNGDDDDDNNDNDNNGKGWC
ncbi:hypothetical protein C1646_752682 [Rhizophagus diaphanus]|nr:hypothetical protein C1646_752682 [Rhizophagus diaphanus] [Rhizophagus sp. MUCL 43196]